MGAVFTVAWKEFRGFLYSPLPYIFVCAFVLLMGAMFTLMVEPVATDTNVAMYSWFMWLPWAFCILIPALAMNLWPDELKSGTIEFLMSCPIKPWHMVVGKFLAGLVLIIVALAITLFIPNIVASYGDLDWGPTWGAYLGALLMGSAFLALGLFLGALCRDQVTAFVIALVVCLLLALLGTQLAMGMLPKGLQGAQEHISFTQRFNFMARGVIPLKDVLYFLLFSVCFLVLNVVVLECRKGK